MQKLVLLTDLVLDAGTQIRTEINKEHVEDLAEAYQSKKQPPPIDTFFDGGKRYIVADGFHRAMGATEAGLTHIKSDVHAGNKDKALLFALGSNIGHGLRRTNADKRNAVMIALHKWPRKNHSEIAEICGVSHHLVDIIQPPKETTPADLPSPGELFNPPEEVKSPTAEAAPAPAPAPEPAAAPAPPEPAPAPAPVQEQMVEEFDGMGYPLTKGTLELFNRRGELEELLKKLTEVRNTVKKVMECGGEPLYRHLNISSFLPDIELVIVSLKGAIPYAVCPYCQGLNLEQCTNCRHTGLVGRFMFERQIPTEFQEMRKLRIEELRAKKKKK